MLFALSNDRKNGAGAKNGTSPLVVQHSLVIPVYRNEENISDLLRTLADLSQKIEAFEVVFVVDGSPDRSMAVLSEKLPAMAFAWQLIELSRNFGSFAAIRQGLALARGRFMAVMAADLQEPPELVVEFFRRLNEGEYDLVVGVRRSRVDPPLTRLTSRIYWTLYRTLVMQEMPAPTQAEEDFKPVESDLSAVPVDFDFDAGSWQVPDGGDLRDLLTQMEAPEDPTSMRKPKR